MTLGELMEAAARAVGVEGRRGPDGAIAWERGGRRFAVLDTTGSIASFRLDDTLAGAARRTPDVGPVSWGPEWVAFAPSVLDGHAIDRAMAWFAAAERRAAG